MEVLLASCGNPDHFQDPERPMWGCESDRKVTVKSLKEASVQCRGFIERNELGNGNWAGGDVFEQDKRIAEIAYNGRIMDAE